MNTPPLTFVDTPEQKPVSWFKALVVGVGYMLLHYVVLLAVQLVALLKFTEEATAQLGAAASQKEISELAEKLFYAKADLISIITQFLTIGIVFAIFWFVRMSKVENKPSITSFFSLKKVTPAVLGTSALLSFCLYFLVIGFMVIVGLIFPDLLEDYNESMAMSDDPNWILNFITLVIGAPLVEELIYRNMAITNMKKRIPPIVAVLISAAVFGIAHGNPLQIVYAAAIGIVFGIIFIRTESIYPSLLGHAIFNGIGFVSSLLGSLLEDGGIGEMAVSSVMMILMLLSLIGGPFVLYYLILLTKKESTDKQYGYPIYYTVSTSGDSNETNNHQNYYAPQGTEPQPQGWVFDHRYGWRFVGTNQTPSPDQSNTDHTNPPDDTN